MSYSAMPESWDTIIIGAGPAGSIAARVLALAKRSVLLIDKHNFPRPKVCGGCLNASAHKSLAACGLGDLPSLLRARPLNELRVFIEGNEQHLPLNGNVALSRDVLDHALVLGAIEAGAEFIPDASAERIELLDHARLIHLHHGTPLHARAVLVAAGLQSTLIDGELPEIIAADSRLGIGAAVVAAPPYYSDGAVFMACGAGGYVGMVRQEDARLNIAAAFDSAYLREFPHPGLAVAEILQHAGLPPIDALRDARWHGTPRLTRCRTRVSAPRLLVLGDAASYVEPFTGEGMAWAMRSGLLASELLLSHEQWAPVIEKEWQSQHDKNVRSQQTSCKIVARLLRTPRLSAAAVGLLETLPALTRLIFPH